MLVSPLPCLVLRNECWLAYSGELRHGLFAVQCHLRHIKYVTSITLYPFVITKKHKNV